MLYCLNLTDLHGWMMVLFAEIGEDLRRGGGDSVWPY